MARKKTNKVQINSKVLYALIESKTSIRKIGPTIGCNEKTIRRGLNDKEMSLSLVILLGRELHVDPAVFADLDTFYERLGSQWETES